VCFRLLAAVRGQTTPEELTQSAVLCGLDVRTRPDAPTHFVEVAWGDCACSLYTRKEGRDRVTQWVDGLLDRGLRVQLLLFRDEEPPLAGDAVAHVGRDAFRREALGALPEARVAEIV